MIPITQITGRLGNQMFEFAALYSIARDNNVDFYFQDQKFFEKYADEIKQLYGQSIESDGRVAIHVRRGDYVNNPFYVNLSETDYYVKAMAEFPDEKFIVFSDDIEWCMEQDIFKDCGFYHGNEVNDLNLMASCKGIIIANSSFSWWAAYLGGEKKVIAPAAWYSDGIERTVLPKEWRRI